MRYIHDWGTYTLPTEKKSIGLLDTTLRDGLQSIYIKHPSVEEKMKLLGCMADIGIDAVELGFPISSAKHKKELIELAKYAKKNNLPMELGCMARTLIPDIQAIIDISQEAQVPMEAVLIAGSSKIRHIVEKWTLKELATWLRSSIEFAVQNNLTVNFIAEDATRATPHVIEYLYKTAIDAGAGTITIADTVGVATPISTKHIVKFMKKNVIGRQKVRLDWHGHDDRDLGVANSLAAVEAGVDRVHGTGLGIGERAGNTPIEPLLFNLHIEGLHKKPLNKLENYGMYVSKIFNVPLRENYPGIGKTVHATSVGIHAAATLKAKRMGDDDLVNHVYCGVDPRMFGKTVEVLVGPLSGVSNVEWRFTILGIQGSRETIQAVLVKARKLQRILTDSEIRTIAKEIK